MNIYKRVHGQSARDKLRELIDDHGHELFIARALLLRVDDEVCDELLDDITEGRII
jgi:hypothetical protein